ncbi:MAG: sulfite exporter TauE/SafE family protein [Actinomycetota bacterium]|nr:sulfite exporter TauE/SafE family protein [Actinomycetota bacterium]
MLAIPSYTTTWDSNEVGPNQIFIATSLLAEQNSGILDLKGLSAEWRKMHAILAVLIGFMSAIVSGMFGIGGAAVSTPALRVILGATPAVSLGTTLPVTIPTATAGAYTYFKKGLLDRKIALICGASGILGSAGGAFLTKFLNPHYLMLLTGAIVLYLAIITIIHGHKKTYTELDVEEKGLFVGSESNSTSCEKSPVLQDQKNSCENVSLQDLTPGATPGAIGFSAGFFSGLLGFGGGVVLVPAFLHLLKMPIKKAFGTSLAVIAVIAIPGTIIHALLAHISGWIFLYLSIGVIPGAYLGARLSIRAKEPFLYATFGIVLGIFGIIFIVNEIFSLIS